MTKHGIPLVDRFMSKVKIANSGCWEWQGSRNVYGYGVFINERRWPVSAHRWIYQHMRGEIPKGYHLDHLCRNRACVNPDHLEAVTPKENNRRSMSPTAIHARKTVCPSCGGEFAFDRNGGRYCPECKAAGRKAWRKANKEHIKEYNRMYREAHK